MLGRRPALLSIGVLVFSAAPLVSLAACDALGSIAVEGADFAGAKADVHCDRRFVTDGGQPAAFCQEVVATVAASEFSDDCRAKHKATAAPGVCPRSNVIAGCKLTKKNDDESKVSDWYYDVSDLVTDTSDLAMDTSELLTVCRQYMALLYLGLAEGFQELLVHVELGSEGGDVSVRAAGQHSGRRGVLLDQVHIGLEGGYSCLDLFHGRHILTVASNRSLATWPTWA